MAELRAPLRGKVVEILVNVGDQVELDQEVVILESMKMDVPVYADSSGQVVEISVKPGDEVGEGDVLLVVQ